MESTSTLRGALVQLMQPRPIQTRDSFEAAEFENGCVNQVLSPTVQLAAEVFASTGLNRTITIATAESHLLWLESWAALTSRLTVRQD